ncbi:MAG: DNA translocase FtsK, partial [Planctomycetota bacterium]
AELDEDEEEEEYEGAEAAELEEEDEEEDEYEDAEAAELDEEDEEEEGEYEDDEAAELEEDEYEDEEEEEYDEAAELEEEPEEDAEYDEEEAAELEEDELEEEEVEEPAAAESEVVLTPKAPPVAEPAVAPPSGEMDMGSGRVAAEIVYDAGVLFLERGRVAVSLLQREFSLDFDESCEVMDRLQKLGLIGPYVGGHRRDILLSREEWLEKAAVG